MEKLKSGSLVPKLKLNTLDGQVLELGEELNEEQWQLLIIYRGKHCPICTEYLKELRSMKKDFEDINVDVLVASADPKERAKEHIQREIELPFKAAYGLSMEQMKTLGLYISDPRSPDETDRPFAEPGIFLINSKKEIQIIDISNAPFSRPALKELHEGIKFIRDNNYPIRGTH